MFFWLEHLMKLHLEYYEKEFEVFYLLPNEVYSKFKYKRAKQKMNFLPSLQIHMIIYYKCISEMIDILL